MELVEEGSMDWADAAMEEDTKPVQVNAFQKYSRCSWHCAGHRATGVTHRVGRGGQGPEPLRWRPDGRGAEEDRDAWRRSGDQGRKIRGRSCRGRSREVTWRKGSSRQISQS